MSLPQPPDPTKPIHVGKVRDTYSFGGKYLLIVASDRISVFDVVLGETIPDKGRILTGLTGFWLREVLPDIPNHMISTDMRSGIPTAMGAIPDLEGRGMVVHRADMLPLEFIIRGYLYGSVIEEYQTEGTACGVPLPKGLSLAARLPEPIFTPSTKAEIGKKDQNISREEAARQLKQAGFDPALLEQAEAICHEVYRRGAELALSREVIVADTKLELGLVDGKLTLCDEVLTPDSSRFWNAQTWRPGQEPESLDKQPVRDYCSQWRDQRGTKWNKKPPAPPLPQEVIDGTRLRYFEAYRLLTGRTFGVAA